MEKTPPPREKWEGRGKPPLPNGTVVQSRNHAYRISRGKGKGGPGRPPSWVRDVCREEFAKRIPTLCSIIDGTFTRSFQYATPKGKVVTLKETPCIADRIQALKALAKFGGLESTTLLDADGNDASGHLANAAVAGAIGMLGELAVRLAGGRGSEVEVAQHRALQPDHTTG